jgi:hypothetical protein
MACPHCGSAQIQEQAKKTSLSYRSATGKTIAPSGQFLANVAMGRGFGGVHWRSDNVARPLLPARTADPAVPEPPGW